jgi:hypothetical protein
MEKRIFKGEKKYSLGKFFSTFLSLKGPRQVKVMTSFFQPRDRKVEKKFPREFSFPPSNILFFPGQYFSAGVGKQNCSPGQFSFHDTNLLFTPVTAILS